MKSFSLGVVAMFPLIFFPLSSQPTTTTLTNPLHIKTFLEVTEQIRCICLPSLPIQSCSYNMCMVSSYLKTFLENRIREGMTTDQIMAKIQTGFGESALEDPVVRQFLADGNKGMVDSIQFGFGEKILARPSSLWINLSLAVLGSLGLFMIYNQFYRKKQTNESEPNTANIAEVYKKIQDWEQKL